MTDFSALFIGLANADAAQVFKIVAQILVGISPIIACFILFSIFWTLWVRYVRAQFFFKQKYSLIEIRLPKENMKSPLAMELFLSALHQTGGEANWYDRFWLGKTRPWFSLEIVSIEGNVHFFIWMRSASKNFITSSLYGQFPGIEVHEVDDYTRSVHFDPKEMSIWGCDFALTKDDFYPIKTYIDYGLDKPDLDEEFKVDPIAPLIEFLGSVGQNQQIWIQIMVRAHKAEAQKPGTLFDKTDEWKDAARAEINEIMIRDPKTKEVGEETGKKGEERMTRPKLTKGEEDIIAAIERNISKQGFDVGIRGLYIAKKTNFDAANIGGLLGSFKQFSSEHLNGFKPNGKKYSPSFSYPWQDYKEIRQNRVRKEVLEAYKRRSYFYEPFKSEPFILNTEELATIFHFPGSVAQTPSLVRIPSTKSEAPANLPI